MSHGICSACVERQSLTDTPVVVVSPARVSTIPLLQTLLRGAPDVTIVVDRRYGERRDGRSNGNGNGNGHGNGSGDSLIQRGFMTRIACLFIPLFPLAARLRAEPELAADLVENAETLDEHNENVAKWRAIEAEQNSGN